MVSLTKPAETPVRDSDTHFCENHGLRAQDGRHVVKLQLRKAVGHGLGLSGDLFGDIVRADVQQGRACRTEIDEADIGRSYFLADLLEYMFW